jgi:plasmid maintenance system antidote protein VapI
MLADEGPRSYQPDYAIPPGATLRSTLTDQGMTQADLATRASLSVKHVNQIVQGVAPITHETALVLEKVTGVPARLWNMREANYRERLARAEDKDSLASDKAWLKELPIKEMTDRRILTKGADPGTLLQEVCRFFGVANRQSWERVWRSPLASFRRSPAFASDAAAVATWLRLGELTAASIECEPYDARKFRATLGRIRSLTRQLPELFEPEVVRLCATSGVAVVFVPEIKGTRASGAARWLTPAKALIQLSLRHKSDDHLWFSFFHEAGHILLHSKKETFITSKRDSTDSAAVATDEIEEEETEADSFAATWLIPKRFEPQLSGMRTDSEIRRFADELGIAPGIVVGRLQKDRVIDWSRGNKLKRYFKFSEA